MSPAPAFKNPQPSPKMTPPAYSSNSWNALIPRIITSSAKYFIRLSFVGTNESYVLNSISVETTPK